MEVHVRSLHLSNIWVMQIQKWQENYFSPKLQVIKDKTPKMLHFLVSSDLWYTVTWPWKEMRKHFKSNTYNWNDKTQKCDVSLWQLINVSAIKISSVHGIQITHHKWKLKLNMVLLRNPKCYTILFKKKDSNPPFSKIIPLTHWNV